MSKIIEFVGVPGIGKSTVYEKLKKNINLDDIEYDVGKGWHKFIDECRYDINLHGKIKYLDHGEYMIQVMAKLKQASLNVSKKYTIFHENVFHNLGIIEFNSSKDMDIFIKKYLNHQAIFHFKCDEPKVIVERLNKRGHMPEYLQRLSYQEKLIKIENLLVNKENLIKKIKYQRVDILEIDCKNLPEINSKIMETYISKLK